MREVKPALVELGVGYGLFTKELVDRDEGPVWAYDLFNGSFPVDTCWDNEDMRLVNAIGPQCNSTVMEDLESRGVICVPGVFPLTFWKKRPQSVSFVRIDMDTYVTTIAALELFHRLMVPGGYFVIHDYAHGGLSGVGRALAEFKAGEYASMYDFIGDDGNQHYKIARRVDAT